VFDALGPTTDDNAYWGLPLPQFLVIYAALVLLPILVRRIGPRLLTRGTGAPPPVPTPAELGFLAAGPVRATDTALAGLLERQRIRAGSTGHLSTTGERLPTDALDAAVWSAVHSRRGTATLFDVRTSVRGNGVLDALRDRLAAHGLLASTSGAKAVRTTATVLSILVAVVAFGSFPGATCVFALAPAAMLWAVTDRRSNAPLRTGAGDALVRSATGAGTAQAVALGGLARFPDQVVAQALLSRTAPPPPRARRGWVAGSAGSSGTMHSCGSASRCGTSCGGSSSGGGGCGGGGGGS